MNGAVTPNQLGGLDDLERASKEAAEQLGKAVSRNAIWDKASKSLNQGLATLAKARTGAEVELALAEQLCASLADGYDSEASRFVQRVRIFVDAEIAALATTMSVAEQALSHAKAAAAEAIVALDRSNARFDDAQKKLLALPNEIQDRQKQLAALRTEVANAHNKHDLVEAVVKQRDLAAAITDLETLTNPEHEAELWQGLSAAVDDLIQKTEALAATQALVPSKESAFGKAQADRDEAQQNRLDRIRKLVADEESKPK